MTDIVELLHGPEGVKAADEILRLRRDNARLLEALKPFARIAEFYICDADKDKDRVEIDFVVGDLRAARAAIGESDG